MLIPEDFWIYEFYTDKYYLILPYLQNSTLKGEVSMLLLLQHKLVKTVQSDYNPYLNEWWKAVWQHQLSKKDRKTFYFYSVSDWFSFHEDFCFQLKPPYHISSHDQ